MDTPNSNLPEPPKDLRRICPFLGQIDDPETSLAFPSDQNYCHCATPPGVPRPDYQMSHCLTASFSACPVYAGKEKGPLPADIQLKANGGRGPIQIFPLLRILGAILIAVLVFMIGWFGVAGLSKSINESNVANTKAKIPVIATLTPFAPGVTQTLPHFPTLTQQPSDTPTETPTPPIILANTSKPAPPQTSCGRPASWTTYAVQPGDTLFRLSVAFGVSIADLQRANCMGTATVLHVGRILYVPPGAMNPIVPTLEPLPEFPTATLEGTPPETPVIPTDSPTVEVPTAVPTETPTP